MSPKSAWPIRGAGFVGNCLKCSSSHETKRADFVGSCRKFVRICWKRFEDNFSGSAFPGPFCAHADNRAFVEAALEAWETTILQGISEPQDLL